MFSYERACVRELYLHILVTRRSSLYTLKQNRQRNMLPGRSKLQAGLAEAIGPAPKYFNPGVSLWGAS